MKIASLLKLQDVFHQATFADCHGFESAWRHPVETLARLDDTRLREIGEFAERLGAAGREVGDLELCGEVLGVRMKLQAAVKVSEETKVKAKKAARADKKAAAHDSPLYDDGAPEEAFGDVG